MAKRIMTDLPNNSRSGDNRQKQPVEQIAQAKRIPAKRKSNRWANDLKDIAVYLFEDVLVPQIKTLLQEFFSNGIQMLLWGDRGGSSSSRLARRHGVNRYHNRSQIRRPGRRAPRHISREEQFGLDQLLFDTTQEAQAVLSQLLENISRYGHASVGDLYALVGWTGEYILENYVWTNLDDYTIYPSRGGGYILDLPEPRYVR